MSQPALPVQYHLELYTISFENDPFYAAQLSGPLGSFNAGDEFETRGFDYFPLKVATGSVGVIGKVQHILWEIAGSHVSHKIMLVIDIKSRDER
jgi:hypothetical protein